MDAHKTEYFECECHSANHLIRVERDNDFVQLELRLNHYLGFWKRLFRGIKYILGKQNRFGEFDCVLLHKESAQRLKDLLDSQ